MSAVEENNVDDLINRALKLISKWTNKEAGDLSLWLDLLSPVSKIVAENTDKTQIENIKLSITIVQKLAVKFYEKNNEELDDTVRAVLDFIISENGAIILNGSTTLIGKLLNDIDENKDGKISAEELKKYCEKICCCFSTK